LPDDELDVLLFPHTLGQEGKKFVTADVTGQYFIYSGSKYFVALGRDHIGGNDLTRYTDIQPFNVLAVSNRRLTKVPAVIDLGYASDGKGYLFSATYQNGPNEGGFYVFSLRSSLGSDELAFTSEIEHLSGGGKIDGMSPFNANIAVRKKTDIGNGVFNYVIARASFADLQDENRTISGQVGLARNEKIEAQLRLIYAAFLRITTLENTALVIDVPVVIGAEFDLNQWCVIRGGARKDYRYVNPEQGDFVVENPTATLGYGLSLKKGLLKLDLQFAHDVLRRNPFGGDSDFVQHTSIVLQLP
jgi:hypothetical protein